MSIDIEKTKVLIVDDEIHNTMIIREILDYRKEYLFEIANNGVKAIEIMEHFRPDIVLLDVMMPDMNGYEVCRYIRHAEQHRFTKIIMVSGLSMIDERLKGYEAGADDYITKPFVEDELLAKIAVYSKLSRIEEVDMLKSTALHLLTHETRTPLNGIMLGCEFLSEIDALPQEAVEYVDIIYSSGQRMFNLISKIHLLCQLKSGVDLVLSTREVSSELQTTANRFIANYPKLKVSSLFNGQYQLCGDWKLLQNVFDYVLDNACRFSSETDRGEIGIGVAEKQNCLKVIISDSGPGLSMETMDRIFGGLYADDILHHHKGAGLSLSICRLIMLHHKGRIECSNKETGGAEFVLIFPQDSYIRHSSPSTSID